MEATVVQAQMVEGTAGGGASAEGDPGGIMVNDGAFAVYIHHTSDTIGIRVIDQTTANEYSKEFNSKELGVIQGTFAPPALQQPRSKCSPPPLSHVSADTRGSEWRVLRALLRWAASTAIRLHTPEPVLLCSVRDFRLCSFARGNDAPGQHHLRTERSGPAGRR
eukprot:COSAG02_NODE_8432_length_2571_cov_6.514159_2_plen_164_part_00